MSQVGEAVPVPLRVLVMGASAAVLTSWMGGPRRDLAYPRALEAALLRAGQPATVRVSAAPADRSRAGIRKVDDGLLAWAPDVVVLHYGHADCVHLFLPRWLERHANSMRRRPGRVRESYRRYVLRPAWLALAHLQTYLDGALDGGGMRRRHRRVAADVAHLIRGVRCAGPALVLVPTIVDPGPTWQRWFPGAGARMRTMNAALAHVVEEAGDPDVRTFPLAELVGSLPLDGEEPTPDGGHFTPFVHEQVGEALAEVVLDWVASPYP